ncbi:polymorphic toxin-type HINT domain-containing protein [[Kitasatospora] papulosa]|uniref:polymorphic toxin-type HINT domain-containing protein n=1 Tax=[Kitasatospora] papulosa TaxID=1464011 RepID=UPI0038573A0F
MLRRTSLAVSAVLVVTLLQTAGAPASSTSTSRLPGVPSAEKPVAGSRGIDVKPRAQDKRTKLPSRTPRAHIPAPSKTTVNVLDSDTKTAARFTEAKEQPLAFGKADHRSAGKRSASKHGATPARVESRVLGKEQAERAGVSGLLFTVSAPAPSGAPGERTEPAEGAVAVAVDYTAFAEAFGGSYGSRMHLVELPACALTTPHKNECRSGSPIAATNNTSKRSLTAPSVNLRAGTPTILAATAAAASDKGDYKATALAPSSTWSTSLNTGDFSWSYDIPVPDVPGGLVPNVGLSYSSGAIDGRTGGTNNQGSWVGDGFDLWPGFIERRYKPCADDGVKNSDGNRPGDMCWAYDNAFISFNGAGGELVPAGKDEFKLRNDDGTRITRLESAARDNGDNDNEYWRLTAPTGVQYYFGYHKLPGWSTGKATTNSTWTLPVYGNNTGEKCHAATFAESWCQQAWRWNLDYVEDPHGNALSYHYTKETNSYGRNLQADDDTSYTRGGFLSRIDYGQRSDDLYATKPLSQVVFDSAERCLPVSGVTCAAGTIGEKKFYWYDTPWDLNCETGTTCDSGRLSPSFWTRKRLTDIKTQVLQADGTYSKIDSWKLNHRWGMADTDYQLLLESIQRTGESATPTITLPKTTFGYTQLANRLDKTGDGFAPFIKERLSTVDDEHGAQTSANYSEPTCDWGALPTPETNTTRCFPQFIGGDNTTAAELHWFNKYVTTSVTATDRTGGSPDQVTSYQYLGDAAWHYDDDDGLTKEKEKTWSQWRGYSHVRVQTGGQGGASSMKTQRDSHFLRGMDGDRKNAAGGTKSVVVSLPAGEGDAITDHEATAGFNYRTVTFDSPGGKILDKSVNRPWHHETAKKVRDWGTVTSNFTGTSHTRNWTSLDNGEGAKWRTTSKETKQDTVAGRVMEVDDLGDDATTTDDQCTRTTYPPVTSAHILGLTARVETVAAACDATAVDRSKDVISDALAAYDGGVYGAAPTKGDVTSAATLKSHDGHKAVYLETSATHDSYGRQLTMVDLTANVTVTDGAVPVRAARSDGRTTTTTYIPAVGLPTQVKVTTPPAKAGDSTSAITSTTTIDPLRGSAAKQTDVNQNVTEIEYDALGRTKKVWRADRRNTQTPSEEFTYTIAENQPVAVAEKKLNNSGGQITSFALYDGFLRERQVQVPGPDGGSIANDVFYDERGLPARAFAPYYTKGKPNAQIFKPVDALSVETQTLTKYDGMNRAVENRQIAGNGDGGAVLSTTKTVFGGDRTTVIPPAGGTATTTLTDARGNTTELRQHHTRAIDAAYDKTSYSYTARNQMRRVTDPAGNTWTYEYDQLGRQTGSTDPDKGASTSTYDDRGQLIFSKGARTDVSGPDHVPGLAYLYDGLGRPTEVREGSATGTLRTKQVYDTVASAKGQLAESTRYVEGQAYTSKVTAYDRLYRATRTAVVIPEAEGALGGMYQTATTYLPSGLTSAISYSAAGSLPGGSSNYTYEQDTLRPLTVYGEGMTSAASYSLTGKPLQYGMGLSLSGKMTQVTNTYEWGTQRLATSRVDRQDQPGVDRHVTYQYDETGNVLSMADASRTSTDNQCFTYDYLRRLTEAWTPSAASCATAPADAAIGGPAPYWHSYTYDKSGNRTSETQHATAGGPTSNIKRTYAYPAPGQPKAHALSALTTEGPAGSTTSLYKYDPTGNNTASPGKTLTWDAEGHLATVEEDGETTAYLYDPAGNRLIGRTSTETTLYLGHTEVTLPVGSDKPKATRYFDLGGGHSAIRSDDGTFAFTLADHHGTGELAVRAADLALTQRRTLPFGAIRGERPSAWPGTKGFVGGTDDTETTGLTHLGAREYDPTLGRFISVDPLLDLADPQQMNGYNYANNNPTTLSDPSGLRPEGACGGTGDCAADTGNWTPSSGGGWEYTPNGSTGQASSGSANGTGNNSGTDTGPAPVDSQPVIAQVRIPTQAELVARGYGNAYAENSYTHMLMRWADGKCMDDSGSEFCAAAHDLGWISPTKDFLEVIGVRDAVRCANGSVSGCVWTVAGLIPVGKLAKVAKLAKGAKGAKGACLVGHSFLPQTKVLMADGTSKPIAEVEIGDRVLATDPKTGETSAKVVTAEIRGDGRKDLVRVTIDLDGARGEKTASITATAGHPFWVAEVGEWIDAADLRVGQLLRASDGRSLQVAGLHHLTQRATVYNLTVDDLHTYYVLAGQTPVLVHNSGGCIPALRDWSSQRFQFGNQTFLLDKKGMEHILTRHHPKMWDGSVKAQQSFFDPKMSVADVQDAIGQVMRQNRDTLVQRGSRGMYQIQGNVNGVDYVLGMNKGRVGQFYPVTP